MTPTLDDDVTAGPGTFRAAVRVSDDRWGCADPVSVADMVLTALAASGSSPVGLATCDMLFADDATLRDLNRLYRGKDRPTNVLAFPSGETPERGRSCFLGGVAVSYETTRGEADERGISLTDHVTHLTLHGMLHLLGYDHEIETDREEMERVEVNLLSGFGIADPYEGS